MSFSLLCHLSSPDHALGLLRERGAVVTGQGTGWRAAFVTRQNLFAEKQRLEVNYDLEWCSAPNWPKQLAGMAKYLRSFEMSDAIRRVLLLGVVPSLRFSLGIVAEPEIDSDDDPRLELIGDLAEQLGALIFMPETLLDPQFRTLAALSEAPDEAAEIPLAAADGSKFVLDPSLPGNEAGEQAALAPPPAARVALRLYALMAVTARALFDVNVQAGREPDYSLEELRRWVSALELDEELEPAESEMLAAAVGQLEQRSLIDGSWGIEGAAVLAWALRLVELPPYDAQVDVDALFDAAGFLKVGRGQRLIDSASLRSSEELAAFARQMLAFHWRTVDFRVQSKPIAFAEVSIFGGPFDLSWAQLLDGDLALQGARIDRASDQVRQLASSLSFERFRAANWLLGHQRVYSETPTDT